MTKSGNYPKFFELRKRYPYFIYEDFRYLLLNKKLRIEFNFNLADVYSFQPAYEIDLGGEIFRPTTGLIKEDLDNLVFHIGMIELISYWKAACPPLLIIRPYKLDKFQVDWWKKLYYFGLGEFFHINGIATDEQSFVNIKSEGKSEARAFHYDIKRSYLVPVGGGKDSSVTLGAMSKNDLEFIPFTINPDPAIKGTIEASGKTLEESIVFKRKLDSKLLDLNAAGFLNGHTPFSALLAFNTLLAAYLSGSKGILLSNESSANEETIPGTSINHQYSKTFEFENDFREYYKRYISDDFEYLSFLRPLSELQIASAFSRMPSYFRAFRSCNVGSKTNTWCGSCPKCLFTYIILSPFLQREQLLSIFHKDLFEDMSLKETLDQLNGKAPEKPFECVGTIDEVNLALQEASEKYKDDLPPLLEYYNDISGSGSSSGLSTALTGLDDHHNLPDELFHILKTLI